MTCIIRKITVCKSCLTQLLVSGEALVVVTRIPENVGGRGRGHGVGVEVGSLVVVERETTTNAILSKPE